MKKRDSLEGPHKKHHNHGKDASVPGHGNANIPTQKHWEKHIACVEGNSLPDGAFLPRQAKNRPTPHAKVNECDH